MLMGVAKLTSLWKHITENRKLFLKGWDRYKDDRPILENEY